MKIVLFFIMYFIFLLTFIINFHKKNLNTTSMILIFVNLLIHPLITFKLTHDNNNTIKIKILLQGYYYL